MIALKFLMFYGVAGVLSVLLWAGAATLLAKGLKRRPRWGRLFAALALALAAYLAAELSSITLNTKAKRDTRAEERAAKEEQAEVEAASANMAENEDGETELTAQFAESVPSPAGDMPPSLTGTNATGETAAAHGPAYRQGGKQEREKGKKESIDVDVSEIAPETDEKLLIKSGLMSVMKVADRLNRFTLRLVLLACLGCLVWDYLRAFNSALTTQWLLPIGGPWLDSFSPRSRLLLVTPRAAAGRLPPEYYAEAVLRKGEQLIFFGPEDPWPEQEELARVKIRSRTVWGVKKLVNGMPGVPPEPEFLLDGAWFRHYAVVVPDAGDAGAILAEIVRILGQRQETRARARRTVHIVWAVESRPDAEVVAALGRFADRINVSLAVWAGDDAVPAGLREAYSEVYDEPLKPEIRIRDVCTAMLDELYARARAFEEARVSRAKR